MSSNHSPNSSNPSNEDLPTYKAKMKILLEQLMLKLEEDVDYQKNLESQIDELEKELLLKEQLIESLSSDTHSPHGHNSSHHKDSFHELNEEWHAKVAQEKNKRVSLEKIVLRLQNENAKLHVSKSFFCNSVSIIYTYATQYVKTVSVLIIFVCVTVYV